MRPFHPEQDPERLSQLLHEVEALEPCGEDLSPMTLQALLERPDHTPALDRWVIDHPRLPNRLIAHAALFPWPQEGTEHKADLVILVHPAWRGKGLEEQLLAAAVARAHALHLTALECDVDSSAISLSQFLTEHGFSPTWAYTELRASVDDLPEPPPLPASFTLVSYAQRPDLPLLTSAYNLAYLGQQGHQDLTEAEVQAFLPRLDPEGLFLLLKQDSLIGICRNNFSPVRTQRTGVKTGFLDSPGILPEYRTPEMYTLLLLQAAVWHQQKGHALIELCSWDDEPALLDHYRSLGFRPLRRLRLFRLSLV